MQSTFSTFPDGRAGLGLVLLRAALGAELACCAYIFLISGQWPLLLLAGLACAVALSLWFGYLTLSCSLCGVLVNLTLGLWWAPAHQPAISIMLASEFAAVVSMALACLGPGAFSLDARRHGRREIVIPKRSPQRSDR